MGTWVGLLGRQKAAWVCQGPGEQRSTSHRQALPTPDNKIGCRSDLG